MRLCRLGGGVSHSPPGQTTIRGNALVKLSRVSSLTPTQRGYPTFVSAIRPPGSRAEWFDLRSVGSIFLALANHRSTAVLSGLLRR